MSFIFLYESYNYDSITSILNWIDSLLTKANRGDTLCAGDRYIKYQLSDGSDCLQTIFAPDGETI